MYYFAYGSNLSQHQIKDRCPDSKFISIGYLDGYHLYFGGKCEQWGGQAYANIVKEKNEDVWGAIYKLTKSDINRLDGYENVPKDYKRKLLTIHLKDSTIKAYVYVGPKVRNAIPSKKYEDTVLEGAKSKHLPKRYIKENLQIVI